MAPSETSIISNFLLPPAPLPMIITLAQFRRLFPRPTRDGAAVKALYAELAHQVSLGVDDVRRNIAAEVRRGVDLRRQVRAARRRARGDTRWGRLSGEVAADVRMDVQLHGEEPPSAARGELHTMETLLPAMDQAAEDVEEEIRMFEEEAANALEDIRTTVGDLSDLRYGKLPRAPIGEDDLATDVISGLARLEQMCREATAQPAEE